MHSEARRPAYDPPMILEAPLEHTEEGLLPAGDGWFFLNARAGVWRHCPGLGKWPRLEGATPRFEQLGLGLSVLEPGEPMTRYHREPDQEDFLVLYGEALAIVEGKERPLRQWDLLHCPPGTNHAIVGAGDGPSVIFAVGSRERQRQGNGGVYTVDEAALRHEAGVEEETTNPAVAYSHLPETQTLGYEDGWLPDLST